MIAEGTVVSFSENLSANNQSVVKPHCINLTAMYKILTHCFFAIGILANTEAQVVHSISGRVDNASPGDRVSIYVFDPVSQQKEEVASTEVMTNNGNSYQLYFPFTEPDLYQVSFSGKQTVLLAIDTGQAAIELNVAGTTDGFVEIRGSADSELLQAYEAFRKESYQRLVQPTYEAMKVAGDAGDARAEIEAVAAYANASEAHRQELLEWTEANIGNSIALYGTMLRWTGDEQIARLEKLVGNFVAARPHLKMARVMKDKLERFKKVALGATAPDLVLPDPTGVERSLHQFTEGKVVLLDFWASWCGPCLRQIPDLKAAYDKWHSQGFEIVGISVDHNGDRWRAAIEKYGMNWPQLSDLKGWASEGAAKYNVTFVPFNFLLDAEGRIVAKNLHSVELDSKLAELLK